MVGLASAAAVPSDAALSSGSGLDPHISVDSALAQAARVARERKLSAADVSALVKQKAERRYFGIAGDEFVNVLSLNLALDEMGDKK